MIIKNKLKVLLLTTCLSLTLGFNGTSQSAEVDALGAAAAKATTLNGTPDVGNELTFVGNIDGATTITGATVGVSGNTTITGTLDVTAGTSTTTLTTSGLATLASITSAGNATLGSGAGSSLTFGSSTGNSTISFNNNRLQNVADGVAATDAVNKRQLDKVETNLSRGIASVTAMANLPAVDSGKKFNMGFGLGSYNGENAASIGFQSRIDNSTVLKVSAASSDKGDAAFGAGIGISF
jgi:hypothetical protein